MQSELLVSPRASVGQGADRTAASLPGLRQDRLWPLFLYQESTDERDLLFEIAKPFGNQTLVLRVEPINRFGFHDTPFSAEFYSPLWQRAWGYVAAQGR